MIKGFVKVKTIYPLLLKPPIKDYLWGGTKLKTDFDFETEKDVAAEAWMLLAYSIIILFGGLCYDL